MLKARESLVGKISSKQSLTGILNRTVEYIEPITQEKEVSATLNEQIIVPDEGYNGLSKVTVGAVDSSIDENIKPENIRENIDILGVSGSLRDKTLGTKVIDKNGTYNALDDNLDGYSSVEVSTSGVDINDYFMETIPNAYYRSAIKNIGPDITLGVANMNSFLEGYVKLEEVPYFDTSQVTNMQKAFYDCEKLKTIPHFNTSKVTSFMQTFYGCISLESIPHFDTSSATNMNNMLNDCQNLKSIPAFDTSKVTNMQGFATSCSSITEFPELDLSNVTSMYYFFRECKSLKSIPNLNTYKSTNFQQAFYNCAALEEIGIIEAENVTVLNTMLFQNCRALTTFGGFNNLGQAYTTSANANNFNYKLDMSPCINLTEQSLINILTKLYDIATKGCKTQTVVLGATNLAKLTSEAGQQALTDAQAKGWTIS